MINALCAVKTLKRATILLPVPSAERRTTGRVAIKQMPAPMQECTVRIFRFSKAMKNADLTMMIPFCIMMKSRKKKAINL